MAVITATAHAFASIAAMDTTISRSDIAPIQTTGPWPKVGAQPELVICTTLCLLEAWMAAWGGKWGGTCSDCHHQLLTQPCSIQLGNIVSVLEEQEDCLHFLHLLWLLLGWLCPSHWVTTTTHWPSSPVLLRLTAWPPQSPGQNIHRDAPRNLPPATLIMRNSIIINIRRRSAAVHSIWNILHHLPYLLNKCQSVWDVIIHAGCNNNCDQRFNILKQDFNKSLSCLPSYLQSNSTTWKSI